MFGPHLLNLEYFSAQVSQHHGAVLVRQQSRAVQDLDSF